MPLGTQRGESRFVKLVLGTCAPGIFAAFGFVLGIVGAVLYNIFAKFFGGMDIDLEK